MLIWHLCCDLTRFAPARTVQLMSQTVSPAMTGAAVVPAGRLSGGYASSW
jgi:hypothetical protein